MSRKVSDVTKILGDGIKKLWTKYHFVVPPRIIKNYVKYLFGAVTSDVMVYEPLDVNGYNLWLAENEKETEYQDLKYKPLISVLIPVYNAKGKYLRECIESVLAQSYQNFEICIVDDASTSDDTLFELQRYNDNKKIKIKHRKKNGHISKATNDALKMASGEFVALVDNDDLLDRDALYEVALALNKNKKLDFIYSDEDKIDMTGRRCQPHFKADFSPDTLLSMNYICHLAVIRTSVLKKVGGFTVGFEGAQDYDVFLKVTEATKSIYHIPKILYHWRMSEGSTATKEEKKDYAQNNNKVVIEEALKRRKIDARVVKDKLASHYEVIYNLKKEPMVSVIIPTKDYAETIGTCLASIYAKTTYKNYEVIVVNNRSEKPETFELFDYYKEKYENFRVVDADMEFNYSKINNKAVREANGEYVILLNNDAEVITPEWMTIMVGYAAQPHVGAVGAKLLYPDNTVQHAGVILGLGGVAGHGHICRKRNERGTFDRLRLPYDWGAVTAACLCVKKTKFEEVGGLDEKLKVAFNDVDFNIKLLEKGYYNVVVPMVELYHYESKTRGYEDTAEKKKRFAGEINYMKRKWGEILEHDPFYNPNYSLKDSFKLDRKR